MEKRTLSVESQYCQNWTAEDAVRELIQNAIDTGTKTQITPMGNKWEIKDFGTGIQLSDFLIGRTSKASDNDVIGQFGEGAPIGCLVLARMGRDVKVYSRGKRFAFSFEYDNQWGCPLLTITIDDMATDKGTTALVECSQEEMARVRVKFLKLTPQPVLARTQNTEFIACPGKIYVNGLEVSSVTSIFGYNFKGRKELVNRDRNAIGYVEITCAIGDAIARVTNPEIISAVLLAGESGVPRDAVELSKAFRPHYPDKWKSAIKRLWGDKVCLAENSVFDQHAREQNWKVVSLPWGLRYSLATVVLKYSSDVINKRKRRNIPLRNLSVEERETFKEGKKIAEWLARKAGLNSYPIKVFQDLQRLEGTKDYEISGSFVGGFSSHVEIEISVLKAKDVTKMVGTLLHEYTHGTTGRSDSTRVFENSLTDIIATFGMTCYQQANEIGEIEKCRLG